MSLGKTSTVERLMQSVAYNDMAAAKKAVLQICEETTTEKHKRWCQQIKTVIEKQPKLVNLSAKAEMLTYREEVSLFDDDLYYVSEKEQELFRRLQTMEQTTEKLRAAGIHYRNAALFFGPSGCGKTAFAKYITKQMGRELYIVNLASIIDSYLGGTAKNLSAVFKAISEAGTNCVLLLDELDAISNNRDRTTRSGGPDKELSRATMAMMQELDMLPPEVVLLAATNHIDALDPAVRRRFPVQHEFHLFNQFERTAMVQKYLNAISDRNVFNIKWSDKDMDTFIRNTEGVGQSVVIETIIKSIADMVSSNTETLTLKIPTKA